MAAATGGSALYCTRSYEPWARRLEKEVEKDLRSAGIELKRFAGAVLFEPDSVLTKAGEPYRIFTPFWRAVSSLSPRRPTAAPDRIDLPEKLPASEPLESWALQPSQPDWAGGLRATWTP